MRLHSGSVVMLHTVCGKLYIDGKLWNPAAVGEKHKEMKLESLRLVKAGLGQCRKLMEKGSRKSD